MLHETIMIYIHISIYIFKEPKFQLIFCRPPPLTNIVNVEVISLYTTLLFYMI